MIGASFMGGNGGGGGTCIVGVCIVATSCIGIKGKVGCCGSMDGLYPSIEQGGQTGGAGVTPLMHAGEASDGVQLQPHDARYDTRAS
jgi:hypothetical protein